MSKVIIKVGDIFTTNSCGDCVVVEYVNCYKVKVKFITTEYETYCRVYRLRKGKVKDLYYPSIYGTGYIGVGEYLSGVNGKIVNLDQQKTPMGDVSKKSAKGLLMVDENFILHQEVPFEQEQTGLLTLLYKDGVMVKKQSIYDIKDKYFSQE